MLRTLGEKQLGHLFIFAFLLKGNQVLNEELALLEVKQTTFNRASGRAKRARSNKTFHAQLS